MKKILLTASLLYCFQAFPVYGMDPPPPKEDLARKEDNKDNNNDQLLGRSDDKPIKVPSFEIRIPRGSPTLKRAGKRVESRIGNKGLTLPLPLLDLNRLAPPNSHPLSPRPTSPGTRAGNSTSRAETPSGTPRNDALGDLSRSGGIQTSTDSVSLNASTDSVGFSLEEQASKAATNPKDPINHFALIADGNRRWAKDHNKTNREAYEIAAVQTIPNITRDVFSLGVKTFTVWVFSSENWNRSQEEVDIILECVGILVDKMLPIAKGLGLKFVHIGTKERLPQFLLNKLINAENETAQNSELIFNLAVDYSGQDDVVRALKKLNTGTTGEPYDLNNITAEIITKHLDTGGQKYPGPDLVMRTTKEDLKTSGFMLWFSNLYKLSFPEIYLPELTKEDIMRAFVLFSKRERSYGR